MRAAAADRRGGGRSLRRRRRHAHRGGGRDSRRVDGTRYRSRAPSRRYRERSGGGAHDLLERPDGRVRVGAVCRRHARGRPGGGRFDRPSPSSAAATRWRPSTRRGRRPDLPCLHRRGRGAGAGRGPHPARAWPHWRSTHEPTGRSLRGTGRCTRRPRGGAVRGRAGGTAARRRGCRPCVRRSPRWLPPWPRRRDRRCRCLPRTCTRPQRARSPARSRPACSSTSASTACCSGHSERRQYFNETDAAVSEKLAAAHAAGLAAILAVGESEQERRDGADRAGARPPAGRRSTASDAASRWPRPRSPTSRSGRSAPG